MSAPYESAINGITGLLSEFIDDDDLRAKLDFEVKKLQFELDKILLNTKTNPRMDAWIKLLIAVRDIIIPMFRPVGSLCMAAFAGYCLTEGIALSEPVQVALFGAPLGYGYSRHVDKKQKERTKQKTKDYDEDFE